MRGWGGGRGVQWGRGRRGGGGEEEEEEEEEQEQEQVHLEEVEETKLCLGWKMEDLEEIEEEKRKRW